MLTDAELAARFEAGTLESLPHADHVRLGLLYLERYGYDDGLRRLADGLLLFATLKGHPEKFHVTMTRAWLDLLDAVRQRHPGRTPAEIVAANPQLLNPKALDQYYSPGVLDTDGARTSWVEPDLAPRDGAAPE
jgi:hypothetical protein